MILVFLTAALMGFSLAAVVLDAVLPDRWRRFPNPRRPAGRMREED